MRYGGIYIKTLVSGGAAEQDGRIQIGNLSNCQNDFVLVCIKYDCVIVWVCLFCEVSPVF